MKLESIEEVKRLMDVARRLRNIVPSYEQAIKAPKCDKHDLRFGGDKRFSCFTVKEVSLTSYLGYYGDSGCGTHGSIYGNLTAQFNYAINKYRNQILEAMAECAENEARKLRATAEAEIAKLNELIASLDAAGVQP